MVVVVHLLIRHVKSTISFHLAKAESQAATMVGVPQGYTLGLGANPAGLMLWLTQLAGRPNSILP